jgi:hypothetical protein
MGLTEHASFQSIGCPKCGTCLSLKVDVTSVPVRSQIVQIITLTPQIFTCPTCGTISHASVSATLEFSAHPVEQGLRPEPGAVINFPKGAKL